MKKLLILLIMLSIFTMSCSVLNTLADPPIMGWFRENLNDPKSLDIIDWGQRVTHESGSLHGLPYDYYTRVVRYRAKNSFGGYVKEVKVFYVRSTVGNRRYVLLVKDLDYSPW